MNVDIDIDTLVSDREAFNSFVYTPYSKAKKEIHERKNNKLIPDLNIVPEILKKEPKAIMFRQLVTPNHEICRFMSIAELGEFEPLFFEYYEDKFTSNNEFKHSLGRMFFYKGSGKDDRAILESINVINFNKSNGKKISSIKTFWRQSLVDFHHELFHKQFKKSKYTLFDASEWFTKNGQNATGYYKQFLSLFIKNGILFENFMLDYKEKDFTREIFLPAFISVMKETGFKPLIVALEPTEVEEDRFWMSHPYEHKKQIHYKMSGLFSKIWLKLKLWI